MIVTGGMHGDLSPMISSVWPGWGMVVTGGMHGDLSPMISFLSGQD